MALQPVEELEFDEPTPEALLDVLASLAPGAWVNLLPEVEPGLEPPGRNLVVSLFTARGDDVPLVTWSAPADAGRRTTLGITHGSGPQALARLATAGLELRPGWLKVSDHPKRGLVVTVPADEDPAEALSWAISAAHALSTVPLTGSWLSRRFDP
ncbi:MAG: hypothetical protein KDA94_15870 [Acidimicrobiales bacterium]|nr:hypothetical protein [Acidimicrobiales bacterium]